MEDGMAAMFPNGIRTLLVDDDPKFVKSATELLSLLDFEVVACSNVAHALKSLTSGHHEGFDVILVHAAKAAAVGFDFRAIVEAYLLIPVIYFLPQGHEASGDEGDKLRALHAGTYIIKKPVDANEVRSLLWKVIAFRKCELEAKARRGGGGGLGVQGEDEGLVHFLAAKGGGRKRKCSGSKPAGSSFFAGTATAAASGDHLAAKGKENDNVQASRQQPAQLNADGPGKKAQNNGGGEAFKLLQSNKAAMMNGPQLNFFMNAAVPPFNPNFFSVADGPSSNAGTFAGAVYSAAPSAIPPAAHQQQQRQQPWAHNTIFGNNITLAAAPTMAAAAAAAYQPQFSQVIGNPELQDVHPLLMFGPFPYQGLSPPAADGGLFTADSNMAGGGTAGGASAAAAAGAEARAYGNDVSLSFLQPLNHGAAMVPQPFLRGELDSATMEWLLSDDFDDYVGGAPPLVAPNNQVVLGKASNVDEPTATAGSTNAAPSMAPQKGLVGAAPNGGSINGAPFMVPREQDLSAGNNGDQEAQEDVIHGSLVGSDQGEGAGAAMDGNLMATVPPSDGQYEDNTSFPRDALLRDLHGPLSDFDEVFDLDFLLGGSTSIGAAAADDGDDAGTSLVAGEEGGSSMDGLGNLDGLQIPYDLLENFLVLHCHKNWNNVRE